MLKLVDLAFEHHHHRDLRLGETHMHLNRLRGHRAFVIAMIMALALVFTACDNNDGVEVEDPGVGVQEGVDTDP